jgi:hypothetical protein
MHSVPRPRFEFISFGILFIALCDIATEFMIDLGGCSPDDVAAGPISDLDQLSLEISNRIQLPGLGIEDQYSQVLLPAVQRRLASIF